MKRKYQNSSRWRERTNARKKKVIKYENDKIVLRDLVAAAIETKKKHHYKKLPRNYATNIIKQIAPKHPWLNKKLIFNHIVAQ